MGVGMNVACEIPLNLFSIMLILTFINFNLTVGQVEGPVQGAVDISSHIFTGSSLCQIYILSLITLIDPPSSDVPISLPIPFALNAEVMPASQYSYKYSSGLLKCDRPCRGLNKHSS